jgi:hypothetical protein
LGVILEGKLNSGRIEKQEAHDTMSAVDKKTEVKPFRIILFSTSDERQLPDDEFNLSMRVCVGESAWSQVSSMLVMAKIASKRPIEFCIDGLLGTRTVDHILELASHGAVVWAVPTSLVAQATKKMENKRARYEIRVVAARGGCAGPG